MNPLKTMMVKASWMLGIFSFIGISLVSVTHHFTEERIKQNVREHTLKSLKEILPAELYDNDLLASAEHIQDATTFGTERAVTLYKATNQNQLNAIVLSTSAPDGYNGAINLLVAIDKNQNIIGVRVVTHQETPGLGDAIEVKKTNWIHQFTGRSLTEPTEELWRVKRDGGAFDQLTGATITPRAIVKATKKALVYSTQQWELINQQTVKTDHDQL